MMEQLPLRLLLLKMSTLSLQDTQQGPQCGPGHETVSLFFQPGVGGRGGAVHAFPWNYILDIKALSAR